MISPLPHRSLPEYRRDVDGLRAVAVLSVVAFHAFPGWMKGGFVGVDVFFVISGFLISSIIFANLERGAFRLSAFYARRIKRIFPALLLVLATSYALGWFVLLADEYRQLGKHIAAGAGFVSNFVLWHEAGYFDNSAETKPLLHLWSLGIEEQFYMVWPLLLWMAWKLKFNLLTPTLFIALVSWVLNIRGIEQDAVATFYSPQTRFWELLGGSLVAWCSMYKRQGFDRFGLSIDRVFSKAIGRGGKESDRGVLSELASVLGLFLLVFGFWRIDKDLGFPGAWAIFPVLGAMLIISAGPASWVNRTLLSNRLAVWFGLISYPLYLWHWPLLAFARIVESEMPQRKIRLAAVLLSIVLAWGTYRLVERPLRSGKRDRRTAVVLAALMIAVGCVGYDAYRRNGLVFRSALAKVSPPIVKLSEDDPVAHSACLAMYGLSDENIRFCRLSSLRQKPRIALIGDSHAAGLFAGLSERLKAENGEELLMIGGRLFVNVMNHPQGNKFEMEVSKGGIKATQFVAGEKSIDTVIMVSRGSIYLNSDRSHKFYLLDNPELTDKKLVFEIGMRATLDLMQNHGKKIIFVMDNPNLDFDPAICQSQRPFRLTRKTNECLLPIDKFKLDQLEYRRAVFSTLKDYPSVRVFDTPAYLCDENNCRAKMGNQVLYGDNNHLSGIGSEYLARQLVRVINGENSLMLGTR